MIFQTHQSMRGSIIELKKGSCVIEHTDHFLDIIANAQGKHLAIHKDDLAEHFFDLSSGFAGEVLQKVSNYGFRLTVLGDFSGYKSDSLQAFIRESNRNGQVQFLPSIEALSRSSNA